jgi:hypothetical protein
LTFVRKPALPRSGSSSSTTARACRRRSPNSRGVAVGAAAPTAMGSPSPTMLWSVTAAASRRRRPIMAPGSCSSCRRWSRTAPQCRSRRDRRPESEPSQLTAAHARLIAKAGRADASHCLPPGSWRRQGRAIRARCWYGSPRGTDGTSPGRNRLQTAGICPFVANAIDRAAHSAPRRRRRAAGSSAGWGHFGPRGGSEVGVGDFLGNGLHCGGKWVIVAPACGTRVAGLLPPSHPGSEFGPVHESP